MTQPTHTTNTQASHNQAITKTQPRLNLDTTKAMQSHTKKQHKAIQRNTNQCKPTEAMQRNTKQCKATQSNAKRHEAIKSNTNIKPCKATQSNAEHHKAM